MLLSHKHKFLFIHIYKNAGTSITTALLPFAVYNAAHLAAFRLTDRFKWRLPWVLNPRPLKVHISAQRIVEQMGREKFGEYFSFAIVRNPWDWQVSLYTYMLKKPDHHQHQLVKQLGSFEEYVEWRCREEVRFQKDFVFSQAGEQLVSFVGKFENLDADFATICERIGIQTSLPRLNTSKTRPYQEYYNARTIEMIRRTFAPDIECFEYDFA